MNVSVWPSLIAFVAVVAAIPFVLALVKRAQQLRPARHGPLHLVAGLAVGPRERIAVVEAGGRWLVVGITPQAISLLATLDTPPASVGAATPSTGAVGRAGAGQVNEFVQLLSKLRNKDVGTPR